MTEPLVSEMQLDYVYFKVRQIIDQLQGEVVGTLEEKSQFGAQLQWLLNIRLLAELCQHGTEKEAVEITDALRDTLIQVVFKK